jgi:multiple sugar transport system permease protein
MHRTRHAKLIGFLFLAPALLFVAAFTVLPLLGMIWISFHNWSLITPPKFVGLANFERAFADDQFWVSLLFSLKYTLFLTPILMVGGYLLALLTTRNSALRRTTRTIIFVPVVIGLGASSLLWYWLFSPSHGFVNKILMDLGLITEPVLWLGVDADLSLWAIIASVTWKVIGFGMILFVGAIQAIPREIDEATMVDGASDVQRVTRVTLPLTMKTILLVTLVSIIGSLLAFDQFYIMTAGGPSNSTITAVYQIYRTSFINFDLGYGAALSAMLMVVLAAVSALQMLLLRKTDHS